MTPNPPLSSSSGRETPPRGVSPRGVRLLLLCFLCTAATVGWEITHYLWSTEFGTLDLFPPAWAYNHPLCKEEGGPFNLSCPFPGYNSIPMSCLEQECRNRDPELGIITEQTRTDFRAMLRKDKIDSLHVEEPYGRNSVVWRVRAADLLSGSQDPMSPVVLNRPPQTLPEALRVVQWRSLQISRETANEWLKQHGS